MAEFLKIGDNKCVTIPIINNGPNVNDNIEVSVTLPSGTTYSSSTPSIGTYTSGTGIWAITQLISGQSATLEVCVDVIDDTVLPGLFGWYVSAADETDIISGNDSSYVYIGEYTCDDIEECIEAHTFNILQITPRADTPTSPVEGMIYVDSTTHDVWFYNGTDWYTLDMTIVT